MPKIKKIFFVILNVQEKIINPENKKGNEKYAKIKKWAKGVQQVSRGCQKQNKSGPAQYHFIHVLLSNARAPCNSNLFSPFFA